MKTKVLIAALAAVTVMGVGAKNVKGRVFCGKSGLGGVVVTDGRGFTRTDSLGNYDFDADDNADFVYIVTPSGYVASYSSGTPCFYKSLGAKKFDFELFEFGARGGTYTMLAVGDTQPGSDRDYERLEAEAFPDLKAYGDSLMKSGMPVAAIALGDLVWDNSETYGRYKNGLKQLGYPVYPVIGNHDHEGMFTDNYKSELSYKKNFGPAYYAFNIGRDYYIVLDNIFYKGNYSYDEVITGEQLEWVRNYTQYIPKGSHVFVAMHAPAYVYKGGRVLKGSDELMDILSDYHVSILSGHTHVNSNILLRPNVREHMIASIGGAWWLGDCKYCMDGTPMGYQVFESTPRGLSWKFKSLGYPDTYQMRVFPFGTFPGRTDELCVKVWNWNEGWKVEWKEDGKLKGAMVQFPSVDPDYSGYLQRRYAQGAKKETWRFPMENKFCFFSAKPSDGAEEVEVIVTDRFGREYRQICKIR